MTSYKYCSICGIDLKVEERFTCKDCKSTFCGSCIDKRICDTTGKQCRPKKITFKQVLAVHEKFIKELREQKARDTKKD